MDFSRAYCISSILFVTLLVTSTSGSKILPWKICYIMCTNISKQEFDILYDDLVETDDAIKAWLEV